MASDVRSFARSRSRSGAEPLATPRAAPWVWATVLLLITVATPLVAVGGTYGRYVIVGFFVNAILAVSFQLLFGYAKLVSFGHAALFAFGGYGTALATDKLGLAPVPAWLLSLAVTALFAAILGWIVLRLAELFLAVVTLAFGLALVILLQQLQFFGGEGGLFVSPLTIGSLDQSLVDYYFAGAVFLVVLFFAVRLSRFRFGRQIHTVGNDPVVAQSTGMNVTRVRVQVFVICSVMAATAGIVYAHTSQFVAGSVFDLNESILILAMVVVGGLASIPGAVLGAALLTAIPQIFADLGAYATLIYGALLIVVPLISRQGLAGLVRLLVRQVPFRSRRPPGPISAPAAGGE